MNLLHNVHKEESRGSMLCIQKLDMVTVTPEVAGGFGKAARGNRSAILITTTFCRNIGFGNRRRRFPVVVSTRQLGDTNGFLPSKYSNSKSIEIPLIFDERCTLGFLIPIKRKCSQPKNLDDFSAC